VKRSLALLVDKLDERDSIGVVVYGTSGRRALDPTAIDERGRERVLAAIERLTPEGSTNLDEGLRLGYEMAQDTFQRGSNNRVILCTDGVANEGETAARRLIERIRSSSNRGIDMIALGFGMGNYNDALLQRLADEGNGQYAYVDTDDEARVFFLRNLANVLNVVARDAKAQVEWNREHVESYRLIGYEKRDIADRDFRNDAVDAGEINAGHAVTALFEIRLRGRSRPASGTLGTVRVRYRPESRGAATEFTREIRDADFVRSWEAASSAFHVSFVAARFAEHLRNSSYVRDETLRSVARLADRLPETVAASELSDLIHRAARLAGESDGHR
jgi:Ca-activated chloride channel family protein